MLQLHYRRLLIWLQQGRGLHRHCCPQGLTLSIRQPTTPRRRDTVRQASAHEVSIARIASRKTACPTIESPSLTVLPRPAAPLDHSTEQTPRRLDSGLESYQRDRCPRAREPLPVLLRPRSANSRLLQTGSRRRRLSRTRPHRHRRTGARSRPRPNEIEQQPQPRRRRRNERRNRRSALCGPGCARSDSVPPLLQQQSPLRLLLRNAALPLSVAGEGKMVGPGRRRGRACEGKPSRARCR